MVENWIPESFVVSFKLETDPQLLIPKARASLERYGHQVVIGNMLTTRKFEVVFISSLSSLSSGEAVPGTGSIKEEWLRLPGSWVEGAKGGDASVSSDGEARRQSISQPGVTEIEELIVEKLVEMHDQWINQPSTVSK